MFKVGDKGTVKKDGAWLKKGQEVEIISIDSGVLWVTKIRELGTYNILFDDFEPVSDTIKPYAGSDDDAFICTDRFDAKTISKPSTIKISAWSELDGKENDTYKIRMMNDFITIIVEYDDYKHGDKWDRVGDLNFNYFCEHETLAWLKLFGFLVEFTSPQRLTKAEYHHVRVFDGGWIARDSCGEIHWYSDLPIRNEEDRQWVFSKGKYLCFTIIPELFRFIEWQDEPVAISDLLEMECDEI